MSEQNISEMVDEILDEWESVDAVIDDTLLDVEALRTPQILHKYLRYYYKFSNMFAATDREFQYMRKIRSMFYMGKLSDDLLKKYGWHQNQLKILKTDLPVYLEGDLHLLKIRKRLDELQNAVKVLETLLKEINGRTWEIKNSIEWKKFTSGGF